MSTKAHGANLNCIFRGIMAKLQRERERKREREREREREILLSFSFSIFLETFTLNFFLKISYDKSFAAVVALAQCLV